MLDGDGVRADAVPSLQSMLDDVLRCGGSDGTYEVPCMQSMLDDVLRTPSAPSLPLLRCPRSFARAVLPLPAARLERYMRLPCSVCRKVLTPVWQISALPAAPAVNNAKAQDYSCNFPSLGSGACLPLRNTCVPARPIHL